MLLCKCAYIGCTKQWYEKKDEDEDEDKQKQNEHDDDDNDDGNKKQLGKKLAWEHTHKKKETKIKAERRKA